MTKEVDRGDIIQVTDETADMWYGCTMIVDEVKPFGVQCGMKIPGQGYTFLRLKWEQFEVVGRSMFWFNGREGETDGTGKD